ncbi:MAG: flavodoxin family protein [Methanomassiliicoccaceae archaeon]|nr:flavodoxin family protein [Methanomassiliicoccaceae archaeon]
MLLINGSPRKNGSCAALLNIIREMGEGSEYECELVNLSDLKIGYCKGCMSCKKTGKCAFNDDMTPLYGKIQDADFFVISTPVYFAAETGLIKNFIDRWYALMDYGPKGTRTFRFGKEKKGVVAITCGAPDGNMSNHGLMARLTMTMGSCGISDITSVIIPQASPETVGKSPFMNDFLDALHAQLS